MRISDLDFDLLRDLVAAVPADMNLNSIEFIGDDIRLHFTLDLSLFARDQYDSSLTELLRVIASFDS